MSAELDALGHRAVALCNRYGWDLSWRGRGCYLHLEASELTEAIRGKGDSTVTEEAGDVLFVLLTILAINDIAFDDVRATIAAKVRKLEAQEPPDLGPMPLTEIQAAIISVMVCDHADWNGKLWELYNRGYTPEQVCDALNALNALAGRDADQTIDDCTPRD